MLRKRRPKPEILGWNEVQLFISKHDGCVYARFRRSHSVQSDIRLASEAEAAKYLATPKGIEEMAAVAKSMARKAKLTNAP